MSLILRNGPGRSLLGIVLFLAALCLREEAVASEGNFIFHLDFAANRVAFDPIRPYAYITGLSNRTVTILNIDTGLIEREFAFDWLTEAIAISPNAQRMYVGLLQQPHRDTYATWHTNYIVEFDLGSQTKIKEFQVDADPWDMAVTDSGLLVVVGGSGTGLSNLKTYRTSDGSWLGWYNQVYQKSRLALHPNQRTLYGLNNVSTTILRRFESQGAAGSVFIVVEYQLLGALVQQWKTLVLPRWESDSGAHRRCFDEF